MFRMSQASSAVKLLARDAGFTGRARWEPVNAGQSFWSMPADMICLRVQEKDHIREFTVRELRNAAEFFDFSKGGRE